MGNILTMLSESKKNISGMLNTNLGVKKESIYKEDAFEGLDEKGKKSARKKIRNYVHSIFESIILSDKNNKNSDTEKLCKEFSNFYANVYRVNDYTFASIASENTKDKETINNALIIIKRVLKVK